MSVKNSPLNNARTEPRLPHNEVIYVEFLNSSVFENNDLGQAVTASETIDISANGVQVRVGQPLRAGAIIPLCIIRGSTNERFELIAEVRWQKRLPGSSGFLVGLAFFDGDDTSIADWKMAVSAMFSDDDADHVML